MELEAKLEASSVRLLAKYPFYGSLLAQCHRRIADNVPTAVAGFVNGRPTITWGRAFLGQLSPDDTDFIQAHEVMHIALDHGARRGGRDPLKWNHAADYAINDLLVLSGLNLPEGGLHNEAYRDMSADQIYPLLPTSPGSCTMQDIMDPDGSSPGHAHAAKEMLAKAAAIQRLTKGFGDAPGALRRLVESVLYPKVDWREQLRQFFTSKAKEDYSFARPSRRGVPYGYYLPSLLSYACGRVAVLIDTSGSEQSDAVQAAFLRELRGVHRDTRPEALLVAAFDVAVHNIYEFGPHEYIPDTLELDGHGGTSFDDALRWADEQQVVAIVVLTDLDGRIGYQPSVPVLWACRRHGACAPFGTTIHVDI